jgi:antitoxin component YwqK of YwqJK toxin-antitoxin module
VDGKASGQARYFDAKGELVMSENWVAGQREGDTLEYSHGEMIAQIPYFKGLKQGQEKRYRMGELVETIDWLEGKKFGPHKMFVGNQLVKTEYYYHDVPVSKVAFEKVVLQ